MAEYSYPSNDLENAEFLLGLLGSHWTNVYSGNNLVAGYAYSRAQEELQAYNDLLETVASVSRLEVPIFHTDNWYLLTLKESDLIDRKLAYGDGPVYGPNTNGITYEYGDSYNPDDEFRYEFAIPEDLADVKLILNRLTAASRTLTAGVDYALQPSKIRFRQNPFDDEKLAKRDIVEGTDVVDREVALWLFKGQFDWQHTYTHFGYLLSVQLRSSREYRDLVNAVVDAFVEGTSALSKTYAIAAMTGTPVAVEPTETVELITKDNNNLVIATDKSVYKFHKNANAIVAVGDVVTAGDQLVDTVQVFELNNGTAPDVMSVTVGLGLLPGGFTGGLSFVNEERPLVVETVDGKTKVSFEIGGWPTDIEAFWDLVHANGLAEGKTLANYLDVRDNPTDEPMAASLPATINPLQFLVENVLRYNAYVVKINVSAIRGQLISRLFRKIVPPWTTCLLLLDLAVSDETIAMVAGGSSTAPGYTETYTTFTGAEPIAETVLPSSYITESASLRLVNGVCR